MLKAVFWGTYDLGKPRIGLGTQGPDDIPRRNGRVKKEFLYGPDVHDRGWVPAPRYVLRRHRVLAAIDRIKPGSVLEIGCGPGALLFELSRRGIDCTGLETSPEAREMAAFLHGENGVVAFHDISVDSWEEAYDLVMACEVLEHIEDDDLFDED